VLTQRHGPQLYGYTASFFKDFYLKNRVESFSATGKNILLNLSFIKWKRYNTINY